MPTLTTLVVKTARVFWGNKKYTVQTSISVKQREKDSGCVTMQIPAAHMAYTTTHTHTHTKTNETGRLLVPRAHTLTDITAASRPFPQTHQRLSE